MTTLTEVKKKYEAIQALSNQRDELIKARINVDAPDPLITLELLKMLPNDMLRGALITEIGRRLAEVDLALLRHDVDVKH